MRIASSGRNPSDKEGPSRSDQNEMASNDDRSFDPDQEPKREGSIKIKPNPSVAEILPNVNGFSEGASIGNNNINDKRKASLTKSPGRLVSNITDNEDDE